MEQYSITPKALSSLRSKMVFRAAPILLLSAGAGVYISQQGSSDYTTLLISIPVILLVLGYGLFRGWRTQKVYLESYKLTFNENEIVRSADNVPTITIHVFEVSEITRDGQGNLFVQGKDRANTIAIPSQIENYDHLLARLEQIQPVTGVSLLTKYRTLVGIFILACMIALYTMTNKIIVGISGTLLTIAILWSFYELQTNKNVTNSAKRSSWLRLLFAIAVIYTMVMKLFYLSS
jgi:hypothetical protein